MTAWLRRLYQFLKPSLLDLGVFLATYVLFLRQLFFEWKIFCVRTGFNRECQPLAASLSELLQMAGRIPDQVLHEQVGIVGGFLALSLGVYLTIKIVLAVGRYGVRKLRSAQ